MVTMKKTLAGLALGLTVAAVVTPGFGQSESRVNQTSAAREAAIHECSVKASKYSMSSWQSTQLEVYGTCMAEHGQRWPFFGSQ